MEMVCGYGTLPYIKSLSEELYMILILFIIVIIIVYVLCM